MSDSNQFWTGMMVNMLQIVLGVGFFMWLSQQGVKEVEVQAFRAGWVVAVVWSQVGMYAFWRGLKAESKGARYALFAVAVGVVVGSFLVVGPFTEDAYRDVAAVARGASQ